MSPAIIVDRDRDLIRAIEGRCSTIKRGIVEVPIRRSEPPDKLRKIVPVFVVVGPAVSVAK